MHNLVHQKRELTNFFQVKSGYKINTDGQRCQTLRPCQLIKIDGQTTGAVVQRNAL